VQSQSLEKNALLTYIQDLMRRLSYESGQPDDEYTRLRNFVEQNRREHLGKTQSRFMYPALTVGQPINEAPYLMILTTTIV
jgi:hypothetical protein